MAKKTYDKVLTPEFRLCFPSLFSPDEKSGKFGFRAVWSKDTDLKALKLSLLEVVKAEKPELHAEFLATFKTKWPSMPMNIKGFGQPFRDGDEKSWDGFANGVYITVKTKFKPTVVDRKVQQIIDPDEIYAGCYAYMTIEPYFYPSKDGGTPGFAFGLRNVMKSRDGERLAGGSNAEEDFASLKQEAEDGKANAADETDDL